MDFCAVILAAGKGERMNSKYHKGIHKVCGKEMVNILIDKLRNCGIDDINIVIGKYKDDLINATKDKGVSYSFQKEQLGTGHAVSCAQGFLEERKGNVLIFACDTPLLEENSINELIHKHLNEKNSVTFVTSLVQDSLRYGRIIRKDGKVVCIREAKDCSKEELLINEINASMYCFDIRSLLSNINNLSNSNAQNEFYLTDIVEILVNDGKNIGTLSLNHTEVLGVDSRIQLVHANEILRQRINNFHLNNGVTILSPQSTYIDVDVKIAKDVIIYPNVFISGKSIIMEDCEIFSNSKIFNSVINRNTKVDSSIIYDSVVGENTNIGPFAYVRPNSNIGNNVKVGDFVEVKNSSIGNNTKISHLSYVGDAIIGDDCNIGCGTITVNYDGVKKNKTVVENNCFVGCNSNLIAPVTVKNNSYVAAGTTVTKDVSSNSLAIGRCKQENIKDWVIKKFR